jgi:hypothetical protein
MKPDGLPLRRPSYAWQPLAGALATFPQQFICCGTVLGFQHRPCATRCTVHVPPSAEHVYVDSTIAWQLHDMLHQGECTGSHPADSCTCTGCVSGVIGPAHFFFDFVSTCWLSHLPLCFTRLGWPGWSKSTRTCTAHGTGPTYMSMLSPAMWVLSLGGQCHCGHGEHVRM